MIVGTVGIILVIALASLYWSNEKATSWQLAAAPTGEIFAARATGDELQIGVAVGGCDDFDHIAVTETPSKVRIAAYLRHRVGGEACDAMVRYEAKTVRLHDVVGDRLLEGCNPADSAYRGFMVSYVPDGDCGALITPVAATPPDPP
jgi:hypothetical protein